MSIAGEATHTTLKALEIPCPWGHCKGHLDLLQDPAIYLQWNREPFNIPVNAPLSSPTDLAGNAASCTCDAALADN